MKWIAVTAVFWVAVAPAALSAEKLTIALSTGEVKISSNFSGTGITVFGVVERGNGAAALTSRYHVAALVRGPSENVVARRKDRMLGIWANSASETFIAAPSFYAVTTSGPLGDLTREDQLKRLQIGFNNIGFTYQARGSVNDPGADRFRDAFLRLKTGEGLYTEDFDGVTFIGENVFRTTVWIPSNVPVGRFSFEVLLFADKVLLARADDTVEIYKTGFEQLLFAFSRQQSLAYGLATVFLALFTGWLAGVIFRRD